MKQFLFIILFFMMMVHSFCQSELDPFDAKIKPFMDKNKNKYGYKNEKGKVKIPAQYDRIGFFQHGLACVTLNKQVALINPSGKIVVPFGTYDIISSYHQGTARVVKDKKFGFLDDKGNEIIPCTFDNADFFRNGLSLVRRNNKEGIINLAGAEIIPIIYDKLIRMPSDTMIKVENEGKWGYIDYKGTIFVNLEYQELDQPAFGMIKVKKDGKYGYLNDKGILVIPCKYEHAAAFTESGNAMVTLEGKIGTVSKDGTEKFPE